MNTSVGPDHAPFCLCGSPGSHHLASQLFDSFPIFRMNQIFKSGQCPAKAARRQAVQCFRFRRPNIHSSSKVQIKRSNVSSPLSQSQPFLALLQSLLCLLEFRDVNRHAQHPCRLARVAKVKLTLGGNPPYGSVPAHDAKFRRIWRSVLHRLVYSIPNAASILRVYAATEVFHASGIGMAWDSKHGLQVAEPRVSPALNVPVPSHGLAGLHGHAKPIPSQAEMRG